MSVTSPWKVEALEPVSFSDIINEELARTLQAEETRKCVDDPGGAVSSNQPEPSIAMAVPETLPPEVIDGLSPVKTAPITGIPEEVLAALKNEPDYKLLVDMDSDAKIATLLQEQFDREHDHYVKCVEKANNKNSKVQVSLSKYRLVPEAAEDSEEEEDVIPPEERRDWDRFETNEKEKKQINKRTGYTIDEKGVVKTKHDSDIAGRRNACKMMSFHPDISTGDAGSFDMKLSNQVFNQLRAHTKNLKKNNKASDRKDEIATAVMGIDESTRLILYKFINNQLLESVDGVISTGKEAVVLHGFTDSGYTDPVEPERKLPKEVAIKIFSTTLNEFKQRDRYIKDDYRFRGNLKQNNRNIIQMWCEKELRNLKCLKKAGVPCPDVVIMKKHILVMSYIGKGHANPAPKLKDAILTEAEMICAYEEVVDIMKTMYGKARLVHADLSEFNILWHEGRCVVIDLAQAVEPLHPAALEFLMRDCQNITNFFEKNGVPVKSKEELFFEITKLDPLTTNMTMLERIHMKGEAAHVVTRPQNLDEVELENLPERFKLKEFPFDYAWQKVHELKEKSKHDDFEIVDYPEEESWVEVKPANKKKNKRKSDSKTIVDNEIADSLKEISVSMA